MNIRLRKSEGKAEFGKRLFYTQEVKVIGVDGREFLAGVLQSEGENGNFRAFHVLVEIGTGAFHLHPRLFSWNNSGRILQPVKDPVANFLLDIINGNRSTRILETMTAVIAGCGRKQSGVGSQNIETEEAQFLNDRNESVKDLLIERLADASAEVGEGCFIGNAIARNAGQTAIVIAAQRIAQDETKVFDGKDSIQVAKQIEKKKGNGIIAATSEDGMGIGRNGADEREINDGSGPMRHAPADGTIVVDMNEFLAEPVVGKPAGLSLREGFTVTDVDEKIDIPELSDNIGNCEANQFAHVKSSGASREGVPLSKHLPASPFLLVQFNPSTSDSDESIRFFSIHKSWRHGITETLLRLTTQGVDVNVLDGLSVSRMFLVHSTAALSTAEMNPVRSLITGPSKTSTLNQGFHQQRTISVQPFPVIGQTTGRERESCWRAHEWKHGEG